MWFRPGCAGEGMVGMLQVHAYMGAPRLTAGAEFSRERAEIAHRPEPAPLEDRLELSAAALEHENEGLSEAELAQVDAVRVEIETGTYFSEEKLDYVVDRLHEELFGA